MKVLLLTDGIYPFVTGGMQKHSFYLAKYLLKANHEVTLVHCSATEINAQEVQDLFEGSSAKLNIHWLRFPSGIKFPGHYLYRSYQYSKSIFERVKDQLSTFDFIYIQGFTGWYLLQQLKKLNIKAKVIINFHGLEMYQQSANLKGKLQAALLRKYTRKNLQLSPFVHSLGGKLTGILKNQVGLPDQKIIVAPIGIEKKWLRETEAFTAKHKPVQLVFIGRNERRKGFPELMQVIQKQDPGKIHLHVVGAFTGEKNALITWHGPIKNENDMMAILDQCDVLICPSYAEGMPTVILEGMSRACAIAATDVGAVCEQVDEKNGWLFAAGNQQELEKTIAAILQTNEAGFAQMKNTSVKRIREKFMWDNLISKIFAL